MKIVKSITAITLALLAGTAAGQVTSSPYSKSAYGLLSDNATSIQRSMGGVGYAMQNGRTINVMNPASYSQVDSLTFLWDIGLDLTNLSSKEGDKTGNSFGGGLDYITSQFKIAKHLGGSFGLLPYSSVGYSFGSDLDNGAEYRSGSGGLVELYVGAGYEPFKGLSIGANFSYLFGTINNTTQLTAASTSMFNRVMQVRDYNATAGIQYAYSINKDNRIVIGATYRPKKSFHGHTWGAKYDTQDNTNSVDSLGYTSLKGKYEQPNTFGAGVSYTFRQRLMVEADFTYQPWSKAKYEPLEGFEDTNMKFDNRWKAAAGMSYTPNKRGSYLGAMQFRAGGFYNHDYLNIRGNNVRDYGVSIGVGLPVPGPTGKTTVNIGLEWKRRTSSPTVLIKEDYFNITLGLNFNEVWFWKNKIR